MPDEAEKEARFSQRVKEWADIDELVRIYQCSFNGTGTSKDSKDAASQLLVKFVPIFKKYLMLLKYGQIDFNDREMKQFVLSFIDDVRLQKALRRDKQKSDYRAEIYKKFNFIKETYGHIPDEEIMMDLQMIFLVIARRYKVMGKSFCGYLYNAYHFEVSRHIKKFIKNPLNITYKNFEYEDTINGKEDSYIDARLEEDTFYEDSMGIPDMTWVSGKNCSEMFADLAPLDRKILLKYYLEEWNDRQISEEFGIHINTVNQKRRSAVAHIATQMGIDLDDVKRNRRSGKNAILPTVI